MKIVSIIGTRPQYIKIKPIYDYCLLQNIHHTIIDTNQHYSNNVSRNIIQSLNINIDVNLGAKGENEIEFITDTLNKLQKVLLSMDNIFVLIYGDTNSAFAAALACYKNNIKFAHVEAGARCFNTKIPEEINRIFIDTIADINFCTAKRDCKNISNGILCGDLEYELLKSFNNNNLKDYSKYGLMTVHRQSNMNKISIQKIFTFCSDLGKILLPIHHRLKSQKWFNTLKIPDNIKIIDPLDYNEIYQVMKSCRFILTDSGGILKTSPFFGKKTLILRSQVGWIDTIEKEYAKICDFSLENKKWILDDSKNRDINFYSQKEKTSEIIIKTIINKNDK